MPLRTLVTQAKTVLPVATVVIAADWRFRLIIAPLVMLGALLLAGLFEAVSSYRCCAEEESFDFKAKAWEKIGTIALFFSAGCLDAGFYILGQLAAPKFPLLQQFDVPIITLVWGIWLIYAEVKVTRQNIAKQRGRSFSPPFPRDVTALIDTLKGADSIPAHHRRRKTDKMLAQLEQAVKPPKGDGAS